MLGNGKHEKRSSSPLCKSLIKKLVFTFTNSLTIHYVKRFTALLPVLVIFLVNAVTFLFIINNEHCFLRGKKKYNVANNNTEKTTDNSALHKQPRSCGYSEIK